MPEFAFNPKAYATHPSSESEPVTEQKAEVTLSSNSASAENGIEETAEGTAVFSGSALTLHTQCCQLACLYLSYAGSSRGCKYEKNSHAFDCLVFISVA